MRILDSESWSVTLSREDKCLYISTTDYHAGPLRISRHQLVDILSSLEARSVNGGGPRNRTARPQRPADIKEVERKNGWSLGISKKEKYLICESPNGLIEPLILSRKELSRLDKMMNRVK